MTGLVFNIQRFSLHDGPGIRTTAFLMGCNLNCRWCHNPEGKSTRIRLQYDEKKCVGCGACQAECPEGVHIVTPERHGAAFHRCVGCGRCVAACPAGALSFSGRTYTAEELAERICRDLDFFRETGGATFSGGEPLLQPEFLAETAKLCKEQGVPSIAVDTAGSVSWTAFQTVLPYTDHFLFDIKAASENVHIAGTGRSNRQILDNLRRLDGQGKNIYIRVPVIPGINDDPKELREIGDIVHALRSVRELRLLPYHTFGREKYQILDDPVPERFPVPGDEMMDKLRRAARCFSET